MNAFSKERMVALAEALTKISGQGDEKFAMVFRHGSLQVELYKPGDEDHQTPHKQDECYIAVRGQGTFICGGGREQFGPGDFLFAPAGLEHRFVEFTPDLTLWVIFYGPQGGEK